MRRTVRIFTGMIFAIGCGQALAQDAELPALSPREAIAATAACSTTERTRVISVDNQTDWETEIAFVQGLDQSNNVPDGYVADTGTYVLATNAAGHQVMASDPCFAGGYQRPIQATVCKGSLKMRYGEQEVDVHLPDITDGDHTTYYGVCSWTVSLNVAGTPEAISIKATR